MLTTFKVTLISLLRNRAIIVWVLAFPLILSTLFMLMFSELDKRTSYDPVACVVVVDDAYQQSDRFKSYIESLSSGDDSLLQVTEASSMEEAEDLLSRGEAVGIIAIEQMPIASLSDEQKDDIERIIAEAVAEQIPDKQVAARVSREVADVVFAPDSQDASNLMEEPAFTEAIERATELANSFSATPKLTIPANSTSTTDQVDQSILELVCNGYSRNMSLAQEIARTNPLAFTSQEDLDDAFSSVEASQVAQITYAPPHVSARFYYALLGMAALFAMNVSCIAICAAQPNASALGARRTVGALSRPKTLMATLAACWAVAFTSLLVAFLFIRHVVGIDFYGREWACVVGIAAASLMAINLGLFIGSIPKLSLSSKCGIITGVTCFASLFAGLYGDPCMSLADTVAKNWPVLANINPAKVVTDAFYALYYYESLMPFVFKVSILLGMAVFFFPLSLMFIRRQRYASL